MNKPPIEEIDHHYAGVIIVTASGRVIAQLRDDIPGIDNPGKISLFGGTVEAGEDARTAAYRELIDEETNLKLNIEDLTPFSQTIEWRPMTEEWEVYDVFMVTISEEDLATLGVYEGQGWVEVTDPHDEKIVEPVRAVLAKFMTEQHETQTAE